MTRIVGGVLLALAALHVYWALGGHAGSAAALALACAWIAYRGRR